LSAWGVQTTPLVAHGQATSSFSLLFCRSLGFS